MKVHKIEMFTTDGELQDVNSITNLIENTRYSNHSLNPVVVSVTGVEIGEWDDDNPLNTGEMFDEYHRLFGHTGWVDAKECLPEKDGQYLTLDYGNYPQVSFFEGTEWYDSEWLSSDIEYWMYIPKTPVRS